MSSEEIDTELGVPTGPVLRSHQPKKDPGEPVVETILAKKITRQNILYYQVPKLMFDPWPRYLIFYSIHL